MVFVPLLDQDPATGTRLDYWTFFPRASRRDPAVSWQVRGAGDAQDQGPRRRLRQARRRADRRDSCEVMMYFGVAAADRGGDHLPVHALRAQHALVIACSRHGGHLAARDRVGALGFELDPFSILVPFLVFAIGVSHGAQKMNGIMQDVGRGTHRLVAARYTFRRLFLAGVTALLADAVGFAVLMVIDIPVIQDLALTASIGVGDADLHQPAAAAGAALLHRRERDGRGAQPRRSTRRSRRAGHGGSGASSTASPTGAGRSRRIVVSALRSPSSAILGEPRPQDRRPRPGRAGAAARLRATTSTTPSSPRTTAPPATVFAVIVKTPRRACLDYETLIEADRAGLDDCSSCPASQTTVSLADAVRQITAGSFEGNPKWLRPDRATRTCSTTSRRSSRATSTTRTCSTPVLGDAGDRLPDDHKAETLDRRRRRSPTRSRGNNTTGRAVPARRRAARGSRPPPTSWCKQAVARHAAVRLRRGDPALLRRLPQLAGGGGRGAAAGAHFGPVRGADGGAGHRRQGGDPAGHRARRGHRRRLRALPAVGPARAEREGAAAREAYDGRSSFTGKVVALVGVTLAAGVVTWALSPIKFQADMGILLTFMFLWNMVGALVLFPRCPTSCCRLRWCRGRVRASQRYAAPVPEAAGREPRPDLARSGFRVARRGQPRSRRRPRNPSEPESIRCASP